MPLDPPRRSQSPHHSLQKSCGKHCACLCAYESNLVGLTTALSDLVLGVIADREESALVVLQTSVLDHQLRMLWHPSAALLWICPHGYQVMAVASQCSMEPKHRRRQRRLN